MIPRKPHHKQLQRGSWGIRRQRAMLKASRPSSADKKWRQAVLKRDEDTCQRCGIQGVALHAHHIATRKRRPDLKHELSNGVALCFPCHQHVHDHPKESAEIGWLSTDSYEAAKKAA